MKRPYAALLLCLAVNVHAASLPATVVQELKNAHIPRSGIAVEVREVGKHAPLISINAQRPMNPASTMKLLTTYSSLDLLGPAYTWKTEAWIDGELKDGVLDGNLILKGYGDPKFTIEQFWLWLSELRARGLREIRGDLILDRSYFDLPPYDPGAFDADPVRAYNVGPDALLLNFNTLRLRYMPDGIGLKVVTEPPLDGMTLHNQLTPNNEKVNCDNWDDLFQVQPQGDSVVLQGDYPMGCGEREQNLSVMPHTRYVGAVFSAVWKELGGTLQGKERDGVVGTGAKLFSTHRSEPLSSIIRDINKYSNNVMARQLFLTLGETVPVAKDNEPPTENEPASGVAATQASFPENEEWTGRMSIERSVLAMQLWLARNHLHFPELVLENGAGLSRNERISVASMDKLLQLAYDDPLSAELQASLPILGVDGSVRRRLKDSPAASHAHLKTGTLEGVKTIAGYVRSKSGREWIVVFYINHPYAKAGQGAQDALIEWVARK
ncbi:D-alanyl-D-alanine carboxypeptidase/D-alanyl-D-alanine endopeptidase [Sideroxydans lithotrophicus]|uniref:D-alanyl-D-alanine carboxypeptidase/D-alanyl-D-alanine-endopeptidase n=1 Tax=Sideroxydans lithotrophicus (strain ES-1) TaxID=580332 RepID=D5CU90_SIDLE|nr:D-alanyl-D-alanine carboxypeptidase/D-alanyl-D-alanine-endopeptidase [Sideroxydans lithotrophicus]ADE10425.1 D-alanyl-D-alanine carboxypeptidase/D-alanyl-D-alanine-endopeptidase [Sideroxydans lithotrophicus ES-1]